METVVSRFEKIAAEHPNDAAVLVKNGILTYEQLNQSANRIANSILARYQNVSNKAVLLMYAHGGERPSWAAYIAAVLGVWKAGRKVVSVNVDRGTLSYGQRGLLPYEFMDASYIEDLIYMTGAQLVLCDQNYWAAANKIVQGIPVENTELNFSGGAYNPDIEIKPEYIASILHTTGTSGEPKAVMRSHSMESYNMTIGNVPPTLPSDRTTVLRTANTASSADWLFALLNGATACPFDLNNPRFDLTSWINANEITVLRGLGTAFRKLDFERGDGFPSVRMINIGGELISKDDVENYRKYFSNPDCEMVVRYSLSEVGHVTHKRINGHTELNGVVPVGYPLGNRSIGIMHPDSEGIGQIAISDEREHLFAGYLGNLEMTRKKLIHGSMFLSGDRGYQLSDGELVHLGRMQNGL